MRSSCSDAPHEDTGSTAAWAPPRASARGAAERGGEVRGRGTHHEGRRHRETRPSGDRWWRQQARPMARPKGAPATAMTSADRLMPPSRSGVREAMHLSMRSRRHQHHRSRDVDRAARFDSEDIILRSSPEWRTAPGRSSGRGHPLNEPPAPWAVGGGQLRGGTGGPARVRARRPRERCVHGGRSPAGGTRCRSGGTLSLDTLIGANRA